MDFFFFLILQVRKDMGIPLFSPFPELGLSRLAGWMVSTAPVPSGAAQICILSVCIPFPGHPSHTINTHLIAEANSLCCLRKEAGSKQK